MITNQKRLAAAIFSQREGRVVGVHRIWIDKDYLDDVANAVQKDDVRRLIDEGIIKARPLVGTSRSELERPLLRSQRVEDRVKVPEREPQTHVNHERNAG